MTTRLNRWLFTPAPTNRLAVLRLLAYLYIPLDVFRIYPWVLLHKDLPGVLYQPLRIGRVLPLPTPTHDLVVGVCVAMLVCAALAATGRVPGLAGRVVDWLVALLYLEWMVIAESYGKVDHDKASYLVLLFALASVGPVRWGDATPSARAGWALRVTQVAAVATYFLSAFAKLRFGGIEWLWGATLARAVIRRGTFLSEWTLDVPGLLVVFQFLIVAFELATPLLFVVPERRRYWLVAGLYGFHAMVLGAVRIAFWPHLVALAAFLPLERLGDRLSAAGRIALAPRAQRPGAEGAKSGDTAWFDLSAAQPPRSRRRSLIAGFLRQRAGGGAPREAVAVPGDQSVHRPGSPTDGG